MSLELNLRFPDPEHYVVSLFGSRTPRHTGTLPFHNPLTDEDRAEFRWYFETFATRYTASPDVERARAVVVRIQDCGQRLFAAVFNEHSAHDLFRDFAKDVAPGRLLTISAESPAILSLPWETMHATTPGAPFIFQFNPAISICRRFEGAAGSIDPFVPDPKQRLRLLIIVSRPDTASFIDPHSEAEAVMDALDEAAPGRVEVEFLRPATFPQLRRRLQQSPPIDIIHFDGHGSYRAVSSTLPDGKSGDTRSQLPESDQFKNSPARVGHLLFEPGDGHEGPVTADQLGALFFSRRIPLIVLSACQSGTLGTNDEPLGCTAARLTGSGIPAVIAMTQSVLVSTTRKLFAEFYREVGLGRGVGAALDAARWGLKENPRKHQVFREGSYIALELEDWFLPALYHTGGDIALLTSASEDHRRSIENRPSRALTNLPARPESGFFGRRRELWQIERWLAGLTRRVTVSGFGGQGKTALALEAGRWLVRTGLFRTAVFVDYAKIQALDAVSVAVAEIGSVLGETLIDAAACNAALEKTPTLVILDNLEALADEPLRALLDTAVTWSTAGSSRVLVTTRTPDFEHEHYRNKDTHLHRRIHMDGLGSRHSPDDALEWFALLSKLPPSPTQPPPAREAIIELFEKVKFHPLSIRVLTQQLKTERPANLGTRLDEILADPRVQATARKIDDTPEGLFASLQLSLEKLDEKARAVLPRLGVFQGGAFEDDLLTITGLGDNGSSKQLDTLPPISKNLWPELRRQLEAAALIEVESVPGVRASYLRFHPTLAPLLKAQLSGEEHSCLTAAHRQRYAELSIYLYHHDRQNPHATRAIARLELPNLLHAVHCALDATDQDAVDFIDNVNRFLKIFGLRKEAESLLAKAHAASGEIGSKPWILVQSGRGEQLREQGRISDAVMIFKAILEQIGTTPTYDRALSLNRLGRCLASGGHPDVAAENQREAIRVLDDLVPTDEVKLQRATCFTDLADNLRQAGSYTEAREAYGEGLKIKKALHDHRGQSVTLMQLGILAIQEGNLPEAEGRYRAALGLFRGLAEPAMEAKAWHQLGVVFHSSQQWDEAEQSYREAALIKEQQGDLLGAARTWNNIALVCEEAGNTDAAVDWYRKAIKIARTFSEEVGLAGMLINLAHLLLFKFGPTAEVRSMAEEALVIKKTLNTGAAEIWKNYNILAKIVDQEAAVTPEAARAGTLRAEARTYRQLARDARRAFPGTRAQLNRFAHVIVLTTFACSGDTEARQELAEYQAVLRQPGSQFAAVADALDRVLAGERNVKALCDSLDYDDSMIIEYVLEAIASPKALAQWMAEAKAQG